MNMPYTSPRLMPLRHKRMLRIKDDLQTLNAQLGMWVVSTASISIILSVTILLVLSGCGERSVIVKPCPELPKPPKELMSDPPTMDLIEHILKPVTDSKKTAP